MPQNIPPNFPTRATYEDVRPALAFHDAIHRMFDRSTKPKTKSKRKKCQRKTKK